jgi:hypothetical protein
MWWNTSLLNSIVPETKHGELIDTVQYSTAQNSVESEKKTILSIFHYVCNNYIFNFFRAMNKLYRSEIPAVAQTILDYG